MSYHVLFAKQDDTWTMVFGDHDRGCVVFERDEVLCNRSSADYVRKADTKIIKYPRVLTHRQVTGEVLGLNLTA